jgi:hypothetical protein
MSVKLKSLTEKSWLVINDIDESRVGLLTEIRDQYTLMVAGAKQRFLNRKEVNTFFEEDVFKTAEVVNTPDDTKKDYFINGYPVDFENPHEVLIAGNKLPLFSKKATSDIYYSAGYYCLNFPKNWMPAHSPKLSTLETYEYAGPFKTEFEMRSALTKLRKEKNQIKNA